MEKNTSFIFYLSAALAIFATVGYHTFIKKISPDIHPLVSIVAIYIFVLVLSLAALPFVLTRQDIALHATKVGWVQLGVALAVIGMELGFLLMYRYGWDLSLGNVVTGVFINIVLATIGVVFLKEQLSVINMLGIVMCIAGVAMVGWRSS